MINAKEWMYEYKGGTVVFRSALKESFDKPEGSSYTYTHQTMFNILANSDAVPPMGRELMRQALDNFPSRDNE